jgi:hypothetical protein
MFNISIFVLMQSLLYLSITPAEGRNIFNVLGIGKKSSLTPVKEIAKTFELRPEWGAERAQT